VESESGEPQPRVAIVAKCDGDQAVVFRSSSRDPVAVSVANLKEAFAPVLVLLRRDPAEPSDPDGAHARPAAFGFGWFVPELLRHKRIWRDVLFASLAIQIAGLGTPLFTQVVIDKVIVHHTQSTLWAVGVALGMFMLFGAGMTWLRQYLVVHTGNRVDAVLGQTVFKHLFRLPMPNYEHRTTGVLVARLQGVEQIRDIVSGAAVAQLLDCPFLFVFLAVMLCYSWQLTLIALAILLAIVVLSLAVTPMFRVKLDRQFLTGARNTAFVTEYVSGMATVKSLQLEPVLEERYGDHLAQYLAAGFETRQLANTYNVLANTLEQVMTLAILVMGTTASAGRPASRRSAVRSAIPRTRPSVPDGRSPRPVRAPVRSNNPSCGGATDEAFRGRSPPPVRHDRLRRGAGRHAGGSRGWPEPTCRR
jgi:subfamily B ATP-binding cassette protein HlyB/CyaB